MSRTWPSPIDDYAFIARPDGAVKRIVLFLHGRGESAKRDVLYPWEQRLVDEGSIFFYAYYGPWSWLTQKGSRYLDDLLDRMLEEVITKGQTEQPKLILSGGSMGGHAVLQHLLHTRHSFVRAFAVAPVTDLEACFDYLPDVRCSLSVGFMHEEGESKEILRRHSPIHSVSKMPKLPIMIYHGDKDDIVPIEQHSEPYCDALRKAGRTIYFERLPIGHEGVPRESRWDYLRHHFITAGNTQA